MKVKDFTLSKKAIRKKAAKIEDNAIISGYYHQMYRDTADEGHLRRASAVDGCFRWWDVDHYRKQKVKDVKRISLCKDKFCLNCQNAMSKRRYAKYKPVLDALLDDYDVYHVVVTVSNCTAWELLDVLDRMYKKFPYIIRYLSGERKCKGIDFLGYGYKGAIRSLEITTKRTKTGAEFHPHFHSLFVLRKGISIKRKHINDFSFHNGKLRRKFTDFEILLQKVWYLLYNGERLTAEAVENLTQGYSCTADRAKGNYKEIFKYPVKGESRRESITDVVYDYDTFAVLFEVLYRRKVLQGYGILNFKDLETDEDKEIDRIYKELIAELQAIEDPVFLGLRLEDVFADFEDVSYISKNTIRESLHNDDD